NPEGFTLSASPSTVTLERGASESIQITVKNDNAPVGDWRFGAITWSGGGYDARIPAAVAGAELRTPAEVTNTGASDTGTVTVDFGYTGDFHADAYGLAKDTLLTGAVTQDPDQIFDPIDVGNGASVHEVDL